MRAEKVKLAVSHLLSLLHFFFSRREEKCGGPSVIAGKDPLSNWKQTEKGFNVSMKAYIPESSYSQAMGGGVGAIFKIGNHGLRILVEDHCVSLTRLVEQLRVD